MKSPTILLILMLSIDLISGSTALAADINFKVPVEYSNLHPDIQQLRVRCEINGISPLNGQPEGAFTYIKPKKNGEKKTVLVKFALPKGIMKSEMNRSAGCFLEAKKKGGSRFYSVKKNHCQSNQGWHCAKPNTPFNEYSDIHELHKK